MRRDYPDPPLHTVRNHRNAGRIPSGTADAFTSVSLTVFNGIRSSLTAEAEQSAKIEPGEVGLVRGGVMGDKRAKSREKGK